MELDLAKGLYLALLQYATCHGHPLKMNRIRNHQEKTLLHHSRRKIPYGFVRPKIEVQGP